MPGQEDHRQPPGQAARVQRLEQRDPAGQGHADVEQQAVAAGIELRPAFQHGQEGVCTVVRGSIDAARLGQPAEGVPDYFFIVNDVQHGWSL